MVKAWAPGPAKSDPATKHSTEYTNLRRTPRHGSPFLGRFVFLCYASAPKPSSLKTSCVTTRTRDCRRNPYVIFVCSCLFCFCLTESRPPAAGEPIGELGRLEIYPLDQSPTRTGCLRATRPHCNSCPAVFTTAKPDALTTTCNPHLELAKSVGASAILITTACFCPNHRRNQTVL